MSKTALNAADNTKNKQLIGMLLRSRLFRDYETTFTRATGLPLTLRPLEFWQLAHHGKKHENPFCALLAENPVTLAVCLQAHQDMIDHTGILPHTVTCPFGLTETAVPVRLGGDVIGYLRIGQVLRHMPAKADTTKVSRQLERGGLRFAGEIRKAWKKNPLFPPDKYNAVVRLLAFFAEQLSALTNQIVLEEQNVEPPVVQKARQYIDKHKTEPLSLTAVAKAAGASVFHFCKVFRKATGLKFTDYVARVRLEDARTQLLNPNRRISEVAYDVGFQSLTQFNRLFKRVFGQSPTEFREDLATGKRATKPLRSLHHSISAPCARVTVSILAQKVERLLQCKASYAALPSARAAASRTHARIFSPNSAMNAKSASSCTGLISAFAPSAERGGLFFN